jgi:hypothetical protein
MYTHRASLNKNINDSELDDNKEPFIKEKKE